MKVLLKDETELACSKWKKYTCFSNIMTQKDVVSCIINQNAELKENYTVFQNLLYSLNSKNKALFIEIINSKHDNISKYMKTSLKTLNESEDKILNTFDFNYHNGFIEENNNFIKVIKKIAFEFKFFRRFKIRIMICG